MSPKPKVYLDVNEICFYNIDSYFLNLLEVLAFYFYLSLFHVLPFPLQESVGGTTYFYSQEETNPAEISPLILPDVNVYPGNPSHVEHMRPKANAPSFFLPDELRMVFLIFQHFKIKVHLCCL